jgi:hypothetical protein
MDLMLARVATVFPSLRTLESANRAAGLNLRGDMAERDLEMLEKFLRL